MTNIPKFQDFTNLYNGSYVILGKGTKIPASKNWQKSGINKEEALKAAGKGHNIGVLLNDSDFVVDFDTKNYKGDDVDSYVQEFLDEFGIEDALTTKTISGGLHIYLKKEAGVKISRYVKDRWEDIVEFKTQGSQVLAPGCTIGSGEYTIIRGSKPQIAPKSLIDIVEKKYSSTANSGAVIVSLETIKQHLDLVDPADLAREEWLNIGMAVHSGCEGSEEGMALWVDWGRRDDRYDNDREAAQSEKTWSGFTDGPINFHYLKKAIKDTGALVPRASAKDDFAEILVVDGDVGDVDLIALEQSLAYDKSGKLVPSAVNMELAVKFFLKRVGIYLDINDDNIKFNTKIGLPWQKNAKNWTDRHDKAFQVYIASKGFEMPEVRYQNSLMSAMATDEFQRHPIREFLRSGEWDGVPRLDKWLTKYAGCEDNDYTSAVGAYIIEAMVNRAFKPGCKLDYMPILEGKQGSGKSTLCEAIAGEWYTDSDPLAKKDPKDQAMSIEGKWLVEMGEIASFASTSPEALKDFITTTHDRFRRPYGRVIEDIPRGCLLVGTTNREVYLRDNTGGRRFFPVCTGNILVEEFKLVRDQIFFEAVRKFDLGESELFFSPKIQKMAEVFQESRRLISRFEEDLKDFIESKIDTGSTGITNADIKRALGKEHANSVISSQTLKRYFDNVGWHQVRYRKPDGTRPRRWEPIDELADFLSDT